MLYVCPKKLKPERSKDMVNSDHFIDPEHFILPFIYLFHSSFFLLWDEIYFSVYFVELKTLVSRVVVCVKMKLECKEINKGNFDSTL